MSARGRVRLARTVAIAAAALAILAGCHTAGTDVKTPSFSPDAPKKEARMLTLSSPAFENGGHIPVEYAAAGVTGGQNVSIPYEWRGAPEGTKSFAFIIVDLHPVAHSWVHWMVTSIPPEATALQRGASGHSMPTGAIEHPNTAGRTGYSGPRPPIGSGDHDYRATLYALDVASPDPSASTLQEFVAALDGHVLASAELSGLFGR